MGDTLTEGQQLDKGGLLTSSNGAYTLTLQDDGNLVLAARGQAVWSTGTNGQDVVRAEVQTDGNFVLYTADKPVWATETKGAKDVRLRLQDDRNLVLYGFDGPAWSSNTATAAPCCAGSGSRSGGGRRGRSHRTRCGTRAGTRSAGGAH